MNSKASSNYKEIEVLGGSGGFKKIGSVSYIKKTDVGEGGKKLPI